MKNEKTIWKSNRSTHWPNQIGPVNKSDFDFSIGFDYFDFDFDFFFLFLKYFENKGI